MIETAIRLVREQLEQVLPGVVDDIRGELHANATKQNATLIYLALAAHGGDDEASSSRIRRAVDLALEIDAAADDRLSED